MKRLFLVLLASLVCGLAAAAAIGEVMPAYQSAFQIGSRSVNSMDITFTLPEFEVRQETAGGQIYHRISLSEAASLMQSGMPELPMISTTIAIPHQGGVSIEVLGAQHSILPQYNAYPLQQGNELESPKAFIKNQDFYSSTGTYPSQQIEYSDPMILRDFRIVQIQINPFSYNASTQELTAYTNIQLRVNYTSGPGINELPAPVQQVSASFDKIYSSLILNYGDYRNLVLANTPPRYLIIYGNNTDANFLTALDNFVLWKRQKGADVDVANTTAAQAGSSTSSIQTYIRNRYNNPATRPDHVILIGDTTGSYTIPAFLNNSGGSDYPYTHMNTGDILGDIFVGRISAENLSQLLVMLNKIYVYERDINVDTATWLNRMLLVGDWDPSGISTMYISKYIKELALDENPDYTFTEIYSGAPAPSAMNVAINQGIGFFSFRGYIGMSGWAPPSESAFFNGYMLPHAVIITCSTNNYWNGTGHAELFTRFGTTAAPKGAVTAIGMSTSSTHTTFNNVLHGAIFDGIFTHGMRTMGEATLHGKIYMNSIFGVSSPANVEKFTHWCNLMGDPTMEVFTGIPNTFSISTDTFIPVGLSLLDVAVLDNNGMPVEGASVVLSTGATILSRGYTDIEGNVVMVMPGNLTAGNAILTISRHNFKPLQTPIDIVEIATLVPDAIIIDDDNIGASSGNSNGLVTAGETVELFFGLKNTGTDTISGITGTVTTTNSHATILQGNISYPQIQGGLTANNLSPIVIQIDPATPQGTLLRLHLNLTDGIGTEFDVSEFIPVEAAHAVYISLQVADGANLKLDPDETAPLNVTIKNIGAVPVQDVYARLYTDNDLISITDNTAYFGELPVNTEVSTSTDNFIVWQRPQTLPGMVMPLTLKLYNASGFEQYVPFTLTVGTVTQSDPLGPDTYGYVIYDVTDNTYPDAPVYDWVEIAPQAGGFGTAVPISDSYASNDEGDQVGANSLGVVNLPFPFQFYGRLYDQITVCSNGFLAMGVTENAEFRNFRLPGAMGPSPMIAPFWDDLATHPTGGIYTYFDRNNHSFIIEWYNMRNGKNGTSVETFQVILYDQATYNTSLGDGPIKFQYHTFNNVDSQSGANHGNYSTIGIKDHTGARGLEYTFNNQYPTAAAPLSNGKALYITNVPIYHEAANLIITETYLVDANNVVEPGETVEMGVQIQNTGNLDTNDVTALLSTQDQYVTIINGSSPYYPVLAGENAINLTPFTFTVANDCPSGRVIIFNLQITSGETVWERQFSIRVNSSELQYHSYMISDYDANFNGIIDENEQVKLIVNLKNNSEVKSKHVSAALTSTVPNLVISNPVVTSDGIGANEIQQFVFDLDFTGVSGAGTYLPVSFTATPQSGQQVVANLDIPFNLPNIVHEFELNNGGFASETGWVWGSTSLVTPFSGTKVWATNLVGQYPNLVQYHLYTPKYTLAQNSSMSFKHYYGIEPLYDGANIAISTNGGNTWTIITPAGGYNTTNINGLAGESGWSGSTTTWQTASFDLAAYAEQEVMFRFRLGTDGGNTGLGWFIDNFELTGVNLKTGFLRGVVYSSADVNPALSTVLSNLRYATNPDSNGSFRLYLPNGTHSATAYLNDHTSSTLNNIQINTNNPVVNTEFTLIDLPAPSSVNFVVDNDTGLLNIMWLEPNDPVLPVSAYRVYRKFAAGPYEMVQQSMATSYSEVFEIQGSYKYYISVLYLNSEGKPSQTLNISFPYTSTPEGATPGLVTKLKQNFPNPFNPTTTIAFSLAQPGRAQVSVYNMKGQMVKRLVDRDFSSGIHSLVWDGRDDKGKSVPSGIYLYRMITPAYSETRKMMLMK